MIKAYNRPEELPDDHQQIYRNLYKTAVDDSIQYVAHVESRFTSFPAIETHGHTTTNDEKGRTDEVVSGFNSWYLNILFKTPKPC